MDYKNIYKFWESKQNCKLFEILNEFQLEKINCTGIRKVYSNKNFDFVLKYDPRLDQRKNANYLEHKRNKLINPKYFAKVYKKFGNFLIMEKVFVDKEEIPNQFKNIYGYSAEDIGALMFNIDVNMSNIDELNNDAQKLFFECKKILLESFDFNWSNIGLRPSTNEIVILDYGEEMTEKGFNKLKKITEK